MDRHDIRMGAGHMGSKPTTERNLGRGPLGTSSRRMGMGRRALAITDRFLGDKLSVIEIDDERLVTRRRGAGSPA
jgi:hypothetical protein